MKKQQKVDKRLLENMLVAYDASMEMQRSYVNRFALAAEKLSGLIDEEERTIIENERYLGAINARFDESGKEQESERNIGFTYHQIERIVNNPQLLRGDFVAAVYDKFDDQLVLIRDQLGARPLYYFETTSFIAFSTEIASLTKIDSFEIDEMYLSDCITATRSESFRTYYKNIRKLEPAERLYYNTHIKKSRYWHLVSTPDSTVGYHGDEVKVFFQFLQNAVLKRMSSLDSVGSELSGGLDSSGISSLLYMACQDAGVPFHAFSHGLPESFHNTLFPYKDERKFSMEVCDYLGTDEHSIITGEGSGVLNSLSNDIFIQSGPSQGSYHMLSDQLLKSVKDMDIRYLFSGHGGDEGITAKNSGLYQELIAEAEWADLRNFILHNNNTASLRKNLKYILLKVFPVSRRWLLNEPGISNKIVNKRLENFAVSSFYKDPNLLKDRTKKLRMGQNGSSMKENMLMRLSSSAFSQRLEFSYHTARYFNIEYLYPLLDLDLIEFYYQLPRQFKTRPGEDRYIYREVLKGKVPESIRTRKDKFGNTLPSLQLRIIEDHNSIEKLIKRSQEKNRYHYLDYARMLEWQSKIENRRNLRQPVYPVGFLNSLQILLLQEMEREGTFRSGIRW
ncbi:MAG: asparagine synthase-related protein [Bacteroidales bacterium]|nr:asparagine synthase-related protein [Bacteroidales bacterium]